MKTQEISYLDSDSKFTFMQWVKMYSELHGKDNLLEVNPLTFTITLRLNDE